MKVLFYARLVCPDDPTDFIVYLQAELERLELWAESSANLVRTEYGDLHPGPGMLEATGHAEHVEWVAVPVVVVEARPHPTLGHVLVFTDDDKRRIGETLTRGITMPPMAFGGAAS